MANFMNTKEVQEMLGVSKSTLYRFIKSGYFLKPMALGPRSWRWERKSVESWIEAQRVGGEHG